MKLFQADFDRQLYAAGCERFIVSPVNSRERLARFVKGARKQLLIYDPKVSDDVMRRLLVERVKAGVDVRIIGKLGGRKSELTAERFPGKRLHVRAIIRDGRHAFVGSQSLRKLELEKRREIGIIVNDAGVIRQMQATFEQDWAETESGKKARAATKDEKKDEKVAALAAAS